MSAESDFRFEYARILWLMAITVPVLCLFLWYAWQRKKELIRQFVKSRLLASLTVGVSWRMQHIKSLLLVVAVSFLFIALARPQWGFSWQESTQRGLDIVVAVDTSKSMLAADLAPSRLQRAKLACLDLMDLARQDRLGLVAFAGTAFLQCPLTVDDQAYRQSVELLSTDLIPQGGTSMAAAIESALSAFDKDDDNYKAIILMTDGEDHDEGAMAAVERAQDIGCLVFALGLGTPEGELIQVTDELGQKSFLKNEDGMAVKSRLNESLLREMTRAGNGSFILMRDAQTLSTLYRNYLAPLPKSELSSRLIRQYIERFQWPLGLVILLLVIESLLSDQQKVPKPSDPEKGSGVLSENNTGKGFDS
ncbi:MAG: vWA domain-containing protein [Limisphaerales bacterium]|nr:VWA domain-containing protein [Verrucomicrobiota bacterium]